MLPRLRARTVGLVVAGYVVDGQYVAAHLWRRCVGVTGRRAVVIRHCFGISGRGTGKHRHHLHAQQLAGSGNGDEMGHRGRRPPG